MSAVGTDVGGTKIEAQAFDALSQCVGKLSFETITTYEELVEVVCQALEWADTDVSNLPIDIGAAGLIVRESGYAITDNLPTFRNHCHWISAKQQGVM